MHAHFLHSSRWVRQRGWRRGGGGAVPCQPMTFRHTVLLSGRTLMRWHSVAGAQPKQSINFTQVVKRRRGWEGADGRKSEGEVQERGRKTKTGWLWMAQREARGEETTWRTKCVWEVRKATQVLCIRRLRLRQAFNSLSPFFLTLYKSEPCRDNGRRFLQAQCRPELFTAFRRSFANSWSFTRMAFDPRMTLGYFIWQQRMAHTHTHVHSCTLTGQERHVRMHRGTTKCCLTASLCSLCRNTSC